MAKKIIWSLVMTGMAVLFIGGGTGKAIADGSEPSSWARNQIEEAVRAGIVPAQLLGNYQNTITREEFASLFVQTVFAWQQRYGDYGVTREDFLQAVHIEDFSFTDARSEDVRLAYALGFVNGTSPTAFSPNTPITRQEAAVMLINYFQLFAEPHFADGEIGDVSFVADWARDSVILAYNLQFFEGTRAAQYSKTGRLTQRALVDPEGNFTREQAILVAYRMFKRPDAGIRLRGLVPFSKASMKYRFELSRDSITLVRALDSEANQAFYAKLLYPEGRFPTERWNKETTEAIDEAKGPLVPKVVGEDLYKALAEGENAVFDLGWGTYEILNPQFLFRYVIREEAGVHNYNYYGGAALKPTTFITIRPGD